MAGKKQDLTGVVFYRVKVLNYIEGTTNPKQYLCQCTCGNIFTIRSGALNETGTKSCGCLRKEGTRKTHRHSCKTTGASPEYNAWHSMKSRCYNSNVDSYSRYGGRGITVYSDWLKSFEEFFKHVGARPGSGYSLDRIDVNGNYEPGNVRWATAKVQANNRVKSGVKAPHGTKTRYSYWKCRCLECKHANTIRFQIYRDKKRKYYEKTTYND